MLNTLKNQLIVSVQAEVGEPFHPLSPLLAMCESVLTGGAGGLRLANLTAMKVTKQRYPGLPIIGLTKPAPLPENWQDIVYITDTLDNAKAVIQTGADIVALDATQRPRPDGKPLKEIVDTLKAEHPEVLLMADSDTLGNALHAEQLGFDCIGTTLSGYTEESKPPKSQASLRRLGKQECAPDFDFLKALVSKASVPVILEGRVSQPEHVKEAFALGAHSVVIGSAITRPHWITRQFLQD